MSFDAIKWVRDECPELEGNEYLVMLWLADGLGHNGETWPLIERLAQYAHCSQRTAEGILRKLQTEGRIERERSKRRPGRGGSSYVYRIPGLIDQPEKAAAKSERPTGKVAHDLPATSVLPPYRTQKNSKNPLANGDLRTEIKNALAIVWTGGTDLTRSAWSRVERGVEEVLDFGAGPDHERADIPEGILRMHELWESIHPGTEMPPQTVAREWPRFISGAMHSDANVAEDKARWIRHVKRNVGVA